MELGEAKSRGGGKSHKGWGAISMGAGVDPSRHHGLASLHELHLFIPLFQPLFHLLARVCFVMYYGIKLVPFYAPYNIVY